MGNDYHGREFLTGIVLGTAVGAAAALLLAPQSGQETREVIRERGIEIKNRAENAGEASLQHAQDLRDQALHQADQAQTSGRHVIEEQGARLQKAFDQGKQVYETKRDDLTARL